MAKSRGRALIVDADPTIRRGLSRALSERDIEPLTAEDGASGLALLRAQAVDAALIDVAPGRAGVEAAEAIARDYPDVSLVLVVPPASAETAVDAAWSLSADVLHKPIEPLSLGALFAARAIDRSRESREAKALAERAEEEALGELSGASASARAAVRLALEAAATRSPVLIAGEDGTGRDRLARLIHDRGRRSGRPFISISCAALASDPEGERLFGAAAEGAPREGLVDVAERGTLFLDSVDALPIPAQDRLLRLLSRGEVARPGGGGAPASADVRVLAGTLADLRGCVRTGAFREELFYRLSAIEIALPPLRDRLEDVPLLAYAFLRALREETGRDVRRISPEALRVLRHHAWPGNARELRSALAHAVALARSDVIFPSDLPMSPKVAAEPPDELFDEELSEVPYAEARRRAITAFERRYTRLVVARESGNLSGAARRAGMDRSNFKRLLRRAKAPPR
jgi:DNA-binding NtrC family response regulator